MATIALLTEHEVLTKYAAELTNAFSSSSLESVSNKLLVKAIVSKELHDNVVKETDTSASLSALASSAEEKAKQLVSCLVEHVQEKPEIFQDLLQVFEEDSCFKEVVEKLKEARPHAHSIPQYDAVQNSNPSLPEWYNSLVSKCLDSLKSQGISAQALANTILSLKLFESGSEESLLVECKNDLQKAPSNAAIFELVKPYMSFLNPELLAHIIEFLGSDDDQKNFKDYMKALEEYSEVTQVVLLTYQSEEMTQSVSEIAFETINVVMETTSMSLKNVRNVKSEMAKILKLDIVAVQIATTGGSPLAICFQLPKFACERVFPLSSEQERDFKSLGALSLQCGDYSFFQTIPTGPTNHVQVSDEDEIEIPCLGRPFRLGMFYDCQNDNLLLGIRLCNDDVIEEVLEEEPQISHSCEVLEDDSLETKASSLQLTTPIKLSLMSNLVHDISKSPKYWRDRCKSKHQVRVCLKYTNAMSMKRLPLNNLVEIQQHIFEGATHVVTGIIYGLDAYCVFDHTLRENERFKDVHKNMLTVVKALSRFDSTGISDQTVSHCKVYSDMEHSCGTIQEVVNLFRELPSLPANKQPVPIPKFVRLYPLRKLDNRCKIVVRQVSTDLASQLQGILEVLHNVVMVANDLLSKYSVTFSKFQQTESRVTKFTELITNYSSDLVKKVALLLPGVREGTVDESELTKVIEESSSSPFNSQSLNTWLKQVEEEVDVLDMLANQVKDVEFISNQELQSISDQNLDSDYLVCFAFHVTVDDDSFIHLQNLRTCLQTGDGIQNQPKFTQSLQPLRWYANTEIMKKITSNIERFKAFVECNSKSKCTKFVVTSYVPDIVTNGEPSIILLYEGTTCKVWEPPGPPGKPTVKQVTHDTVQLEWPKPEYGSQSVECYQVSYHPVDNTQRSWSNVMTTNNAQETTTVCGLVAATKYVFSVQSKCEVGVGNKGDTSDLVEMNFKAPSKVALDLGAKQTTCKEASHSDTSVQSERHSNSNNLLPTMSGNIIAGPQLANSKPMAASVSHDSVTLEWALPADQSSDNVECYTVNYRSVDDSSKKWKKVMTDSSDQPILVSKLSPQTKYVFKVRPELEDGVGMWSEISDPIETKAPVCQPGKPSASAVSHDSITLQWEKPEYDWENVESYLVRYRQESKLDKKWGKAYTESSETLLTVTKLAPKTSYIFKVRPELDDSGVGAESEISEPIKTESEVNSAESVGLGKPKATNITHDSITVSWNKPNQEIECYIVSYRLVDDAVTNMKHLTVLEESVTVSGLTCDTTYLFTIRSESRTAIGLSSELSNPIATRATSLPGKPTASAVTHNSVELKWSKPEWGCENMECFKIMYCSLEKLTSDDEWEELSVEKQKQSVVVDNLSPKMKYVFKVVTIIATSEQSVGSASELSEHIETKLCSPPGKPEAVSVTHNSITLAWSKPEYGSENVEWYIIQIECEESDTVTVLKHLKTEEVQETIVMRQLEVRKTYKFKVHPECGEGGVGMESETSQEIETMATSPPGKPMVSNVTHNSMRVYWTKPEEFDSIIGYKVWYKKVQDKKWIKDIPNTPVNNFIIVKNINFDSEYVFKVVPLCESGKGTESEISDPVRTKTTSPPGKLKATAQHHNSVDLEWTKPDYGSENVIKYECIVYYKVSEELEYTKFKSVSTTGAEEKLTVGELSPERKFVFKVRPHCLTGPGAESEPSMPIETKPVPFKPGKPEAEVVLCEKITVKWRRPSHDWGDLGDSFYVHYCEVNDSQLNWKKFSGEVNAKHQYTYSCTVDNLQPGKLYAFKVQSYFPGGEVAETSELSESIRTKAASYPSKPQATDVTHNSIKLEWTKPKYGSDNVDFYTITINYSSDSVFKQPKSIDTSGVEESFVIQNLTGKTEYTFTVTPHCRVGEGQASVKSDPIETQPSCRPGKARCVPNSTTYDTITLNWTKPESFSKGIKHYKLSYHSNHRPDKGHHDIPSSFGNYIEWPITGLSHNTTYIFEVLPVCKDSTVPTESSISDPITTMATSPPGKPIAITYETTHNSVKLEWGKPALGSESIMCYRIMYHVKPSSFFSGRPYKYTIKTDDARESETIEDLTNGTEYIFKVQAVCKGETEKKVQVGMESDPSDPIETKLFCPPSKPKVISTTHDSVTLEWDKPQCGLSNVSHYDVLQRLKNENEWKDCSKKLSLQETSTCKALVSQLNSNTSYVFRITAVGAKGCGQTSPSEISESVITKATAPPGKPRLSVQDTDNVTHNSMCVEWVHPTYGYESIEHYKVSYVIADSAKEAQCHSYYSTDWKSEKTQAKETHVWLNGLKMGSQYIVKVLPICTQGEGTESELSEPIRTRITSKPGKPEATKVTHNSVTLKWTKPDEGNPDTFKYRFLYSTEESNIWKSLSEPIPLGSYQTAAILQLNPHTHYQFKVQAKRNQCFGCCSDASDVIVTDPICKPGKPRSTEITHESISLTWDVPKHGSENVKSYTVQYRDNVSEGNWTEVGTDKNASCVNIRGLAGYTMYAFKSVCNSSK